MPTSYAKQEIVNLFHSGDKSEMAKFVAGCPDFPLKAQAVDMVKWDMPGAQALALGMVSQGLAFGRAADAGAEVAMAAHTLSREDFDKHGPTVILPVTNSRLAYEAMHALNVAGRYDDAVAFAKKVEPLYEEEPENGPSIRVAKITALFEQNRIDEARKLIAEERDRGFKGPHLIELDRLEGNINMITDDVTRFATERSPTIANVDLANENARQRHVMDAITEILAGSGEEMNEWQAMKLIRDGTSIFTHPEKAYNPSFIRESLAKLVLARKWTRENNSRPNENDALWGIYLCYSRLDKPADAAAALQSLRENIEEMRANIASPLERGGVSRTYPYLFEALCQKLTQSRQPLALLDAMEGAKGRAVADLVVKRSGKPVDDRELARPALRLPELMKRIGANYLSFFVDDDATYAALVAKNGTVHAAEGIPIGKKQIRETALCVDPFKWGVDPSDPMGARVTPTTETLSALLKWLEPYYDSGVLAEGDHICYSPDEHLHHVPLHYLPFRGKPLAATFSVSRTHGAYAISLQLDRPQPPVYKQYTAVEVPTVQNMSNASFMEALHRVPAWLGENLNGKLIEGESGTAEVLRTLDLAHRVVHFATHGIFPAAETAAEQNPYRASGLLLAGPDGIPDTEKAAAGDREDNMFTPKHLLDLDLVLTGSHVTLGACVSGLAAEGIGGDALGMDWAFTQAGASSLLVSHWNVNVASTAEFFVRFYRHWLLERLSKAEAWRKTIMDLWEAGGKLGEIRSWAAFSLCGDWR
jgi:CHAT domain-containing protein